ncbi:MAG: hypothetical protein ACRBDI_02365 [Alphaproteobacteria bacterium]
MGIITSGIIDGIHYDPIPSHGTYGWSIKYGSSDAKGVKHYGSQNGIKKKDISSCSFYKGDVISVSYLENSSQINAIYINSLCSRYSLKKSKKARRAISSGFRDFYN